MDLPIETLTQPAAITALHAVHDEDLRVPYYCEENAWRLVLRKMQAEPEDRFFVVIISNPIKSVPMFHQRASLPDTVIYWDYHVIVLRARLMERDVLVYDIDSRLPYPVSLSEYLTRSFAYHPLVSSPHAPMFRLIPAHLYITNFASDRLHMYSASKKDWSAPPPSYPCINVSIGKASNIQSYLDFTEPMSKDRRNQTMNHLGVLLSLEELAKFPDFFFSQRLSEVSYSY